MKIFCSKDCPDLCGIDAQFTNGKPVFKGIKESWQKEGFICSKFKVFAEREIGSDLKSYARYGKERLEFDTNAQALNALADLLSRFKNKKILYLRGSGSLAYNMGWWDMLLSGFENVYKISGGVCDNTGDDAHEHDFGTALNPPAENIGSADTVILFGKNAAVISQHLYAYLKELKKLGKTIIYIDPIRTKTAELATKYIRINPAADGLLACSLMDALGVEKYENAQELLSLTGINAEDFEFLHKSINGNTAFIEGFGMQRHSNGMNIVRLINRLAVKTGNIDRLYYGHGSKRYWEGLKTSFKHSVSIHEAAKRLSEGEFDLFVNIAANPAVTYPDAVNWVTGIKNTPTVVADVCGTRTSENCIFFLKVGGMFAQNDFMASYFFEHFHSRDRFIDGLSDVDAVKYLGSRLGINIDFREPERVVLAGREYRDERIEPVLPEISGKFQLFSASHHAYLNSQITCGQEQGMQVVMINPKDARKLGLHDGDDVKVETRHGFYVGEAEITEDVPEKMVLSWKNLPMKTGYVNDAIPPRLTDSGTGMVYYTVFCDISKLEKRGVKSRPS